jgi:hypothetical protein
MSDPLVQITIRGASAAIINNTVYAAIINPPNATTWIATAVSNGTIRFTDQASGLALSSPDTKTGTQAIVAPPGSGLPVTSWTVVQFSDDDGDDATSVTDPSQLTSGYYTIQEPGTGEYLFRNRIEDYSIRPKVVALQPPDDSGAYELVIQVVG